VGNGEIADAKPRELCLAVTSAASMFVTELSLRRDPRGLPDEYPYSLPAIRQLETLRFPTAVTFLVGENGSGKSKLLEGIAGAFGLNPEGGTKHVRFATRTSHSPLFKDLKLKKVPPAPTDSYFLRAETFYNVASAIERPEDRRAFDLEAFGGRSLHDRSHGEAFLALVLHACVAMASISSMSPKPLSLQIASLRSSRRWDSW
jgi:predicted ATPase